MTVQIHRLEGFYWVARAGGFAAAAKAFPYPITQPGVYQQVRRLEEELGTVLCERATRDRVRLTAEGERLFAFCAPFFEGLPGALRTLGDAAENSTVRIDAAGLPLRQLLPGWVRAFAKSHPRVVVELEEIQVPDVERLRRGTADIIVDAFARVPEGFAHRKVAVASSFLVIPREHARGSGPPTRATLRALPFVSYHPTLPQHAAQIAAVKRHVGELSRTVSASSADSILAFVAAGLGYSVIPWLEPRGPRGPGIRAFEQRGPGSEHAVLAVYRNADPPNKIVEAVLAAAGADQVRRE